MGKNCCPDAGWLSELEIAELNAFRLQIKTLARAASGQQGAIINDVGDDLHTVATEKLLRQSHRARRRRPNSGKSSCTQYRQDCRKLGQMQVVLKDCHKRAKHQQ